GGAHQVTEHHCQLAPLSFRGSPLGPCRCGSCLRMRSPLRSLGAFPLAARDGGRLPAGTEPCPAGRAELGLRRILFPTPWAAAVERAAALDTELRSLRILTSAL